MNPEIEGLKAALRLKNIEYWQVKKEFWYERYCRASEQLTFCEAQIKEAKRISEKKEDLC